MDFSTLLPSRIISLRYIYLMRRKSETFKNSKELQNKVGKSRKKKIKFLRSDRGGEYLGYEFKKQLKSRGIVSQLIPPRTEEWSVQET